jgi:hypothetical protein
MICARVYVQGGIKTRLAQRLGQSERILLERQILPGVLQPLLNTAQLQIIPGNFGGERNQRIVSIFHRGFEIRSRRLDLPPLTPEDVDLPTGIETRLPDVRDDAPVTDRVAVLPGINSSKGAGGIQLGKIGVSG